MWWVAQFHKRVPTGQNNVKSAIEVNVPEIAFNLSHLIRLQVDQIHFHGGSATEWKYPQHPPTQGADKEAQCECYCPGSRDPVEHFIVNHKKEHGEGMDCEWVVTFQRLLWQ